MNPLLRRSAAHVFVESLEHPLLTADDQHHLARVLRLRTGELVSATDGAGSWRICAFTADGSLQPSGVVICEQRPDPVTVGFAIPKGDRPEWIVQKLTEIGVDRIVLLHTERSVVHWDDGRAAKHVDKLGRVAREAAMQSRRTWLPAIDGPLEASSLIAATPCAALAEPDGAPLRPEDRVVLIGPEGGWSATELAAGARQVGLGPSILRVETAALVAATLLVSNRR